MHEVSFYVDQVNEDPNKLPFLSKLFTVAFPTNTGNIILPLVKYLAMLKI